jgi:hypothetical protein
MPSISWESLLTNPIGAAGTAYASSNTITDVSPSPGLQLPANLLGVNSVITVESWLSASNTATPTLLLGVYYGGVAGVALAATSAITTTTAMTAWPWRIRYKGIVRTTGTTGTIIGGGDVWVPTSLTAGAWRPIPETAFAAVTIDTTVAKTVTIGATWGTNSASNTLTVQGMFASGG